MRALRLAALLFLLSAQCVAQYGEPLSAGVEALMARALAGDAEAQFRVATAYDWGEGAPRDGSEALRWYELSASSGYSEAQNSLGSSLQAEGKYEQALVWYERAAEQDHALAINNLADLYNLGLGVAQDRSKAYELFLRSAELGWDEAMWNIANLYGAGNLGGKQDFFMACVWASRALSHTERGSAVFDRATQSLSYLRSKLGRNELSDCQFQSKQWSPTRAAA